MIKFNLKPFYKRSGWMVGLIFFPIFLLLNFFQLNAQCFQTISVAYGHTLAIKPDGSLWGWGRFPAGYDGGQDIYISPILIDPGPWLTVSGNRGISGEYSLGIKTNGTLWGWGNNSKGQAGQPSIHTSIFMTQIGTDSDWVAVTAGDQTSGALKRNGTVWCWGDNTKGEFGNGVTGGTSNIPAKVGNDSDWVDIKVGSVFVIAKKSNGTLWGWGDNSVGELGIGNTTSHNTPVQIGASTNWKTFSPCQANCMGIRTDGSLWTWGANNSGEIGNGTESSTTYILLPTHIGTDTNWVSVGNGINSSYAIKSNGSLWAWGWGAHYQLGNGGTGDVLSPLHIGTDSNWKSVSGAYYYAIAQKNDNTVWATGQNTVGQLGDSTLTDKYYFSPSVCGSNFCYTFIGNGNWDSAANWFNKMIPPPVLPAGNEIVINPVDTGQCYLNVTQHILSGAKMYINERKILFIPGELKLQ